MKTLNVALLGYGYAGKTFHAPLVSAVPGMNLKTVVSSDASKVQKDIGSVQVVSDPESVFADPQIDLIVIATPNTTHCELAERALRAGKNVVVDKPLAISLDEAARLRAVADVSDGLVSVFQNRRWDADFLTLRQLIASGELGEVVYLQSNFDRYRPLVQKRWREQDIPGSGLWFDLGSHLVDQIVVLFGLPEKIQADLAIQREGGQATDYFHVTMHYGIKRVVLHGSCLVAAESPRFTVHGTTGSFIKFGLDTQEQALKDGGDLGSFDWGADPEAGKFVGFQDGARHEQPIPNRKGNYCAYYEAIRDAIVDGKANPVTIDHAVSVMNLLDIAVQSSQSGKTLPVSLRR